MKRFMVSFVASVHINRVKGTTYTYISHVDVEVPDNYRILDYASISEKADPLIADNINVEYPDDRGNATFHIMAFSRYEE